MYARTHNPTICRVLLAEGRLPEALTELLALASLPADARAGSNNGPDCWDTDAAYGGDLCLDGLHRVLACACAALNLVLLLCRSLDCVYDIGCMAHTARALC